MFNTLDSVIWNVDSKNNKPIYITINKGYIVSNDSNGRFPYIWDDVYDTIPINTEDYITPEKYAFNKYGYKHLDILYHKLENRNIQVLDIQSYNLSIVVCYVDENNSLTRSDIENFISIKELRDNIINEILD